MSTPRIQILSFCLIPSYSVVAYANQYLTVNNAQKILFPDSSRFDKKKYPLSKEQLLEIVESTNVKVRSDDFYFWKVFKNQTHIGYFIVDEVVGKHENITYAIAVDTNKSVLGVEIMDYRETHGKQVMNKEWRQQFKDKTVSDSLRLDVDIKNITGATLSCRHITDGVKRVLKTLEVLKIEN